MGEVVPTSPCMGTRTRRIVWIGLLAILAVGLLGAGLPHDWHHHGDRGVEDDGQCALCVFGGFEIEESAQLLRVDTKRLGLVQIASQRVVGERAPGASLPRAPPA